MQPARLTPTGEPADPGEAPFERRSDPIVGQGVETMADWQIKGLVLLGAALAGLTLAASASAAAQVAADRTSCAIIASSSDGGFLTGGVLACCLRWTPQADA
jgi:hypothetical protein